jgi:hypothetical protein
MHLENRNSFSVQNAYNKFQKNSDGELVLVFRAFGPALESGRSVNMKLRDHPLMSHKGFRSWPPMWVRIDDPLKRSFEGDQIGVLTQIRMLNLQECGISIRMQDVNVKYFSHLLACLRNIEKADRPTLKGHWRYRNRISMTFTVRLVHSPAASPTSCLQLVRQQTAHRWVSFGREGYRGLGN